MSITTTFFGDQDRASDGTAPLKGWFRRLVEARQQPGRARMRAAYAQMSDHLLADIGFNPDEIRSIRVQASIPDTFWA